MKMYEILIPVLTNAGKSYEVIRRTFEHFLMAKANGFTRMNKVTGAWRSIAGAEYWEEMIPYRVYCNEKIFAEITAEAFNLFSDQLAFMIVELGDAKILIRESPVLVQPHVLRSQELKS